MQPPDRVLSAFGTVGPARPLPGGRGSSWRTADRVLKPIDLLPDELEWLHRIPTVMAARDAARGAPADDLRLSVPIASASGALVVDGWTAFPLLAGEHRASRWTEIARVGRQFSSRFAGVGRPAFMEARNHAWARADRLAWGDADSYDLTEAPFLTELLAARRQVTDRSGIIHGDLTGNVLFHDVERPAVIDLTVYWGPVRYAIAIVAVDAVCFEGAPLSLLETIEQTDGFPQHLVRALIFRIATDWFNGLHPGAGGTYDDAVARVLELVSQSRA
ncbi:hypothetical protein ASF62_13170 [Leifsonia sp. Leaf325]|nr:hypothetical protein [Leifsonia sp. Leaf325]KQQ92767.1 hypothetical protein ASF62_13170 [Leifsonia sp. Leaf325]